MYRTVQEMFDLLLQQRQDEIVLSKSGVFTPLHSDAILYEENNQLTGEIRYIGILKKDTRQDLASLTMKYTYDTSIQNWKLISCKVFNIHEWMSKNQTDQ